MAKSAGSSESVADDIAIRVADVTKTFKLPHERHSSIKSAVLNFYRRRSYERQSVLHDVSFEIKKGEFFGIVGRNGSGKSTLLKLLAGIYSPNKGSIEINGKLTPFIELGVGFNHELTGRENVFLNGALLGFSHKEMEEMYDDIVAFAELSRFMDQKLKNYSSGMQVRLAFSIAIRANTEILILDEVLAVGDESFQRKCFEYFGEVKKTKKTVVLVTHDMNSIEKFCTRALHIKDGKVLTIGSPQEVAASYVVENSADLQSISMDKKDQKEAPPSTSVDVTKVEVFKDGKATLTFGQADDITVRVHYRSNKDQAATIGISFRTIEGVLLAGIGSRPDIGLTKLAKGDTGYFDCRIAAGQLRKGNYSVNASIWSESRSLLGYSDVTFGSKVPVVTVVEDRLARSGQFNISGAWSDSVRSHKSHKGKDR